MALLAMGVAQSDHVVNVIALNRGGHFVEPLREAGISVSVLQKRFRFDPFTWWKLRQTLRRQSPDIVQSFLFSANTYTRLPGICPAGARIIVSERCVDSWKSGWQLRVDRMLKSRMQCMTANSQAVADFYQTRVGVLPGQMRVIPNGVPTPPEASASARDLRTELDLPPDALIMGYAGRLAAQKCLRDLVWAFHLLHQAVEDAVLVLVGEGPERDDLAEFASSVGCRDRVYFTGHRADASRLIAQFNVFCLTSSFEGMSNSLLEAMAAGTPVVVSNIPANTQLIEHEVNGLVCPHGDSAEYARAVRRLLTDQEFAEQLSVTAQTMVRQQHSIAQLVDSHLKLYDESGP